MATGDKTALFDGLTVEDGEAADVAQSRSSALDGTPIRDWVKDSRSQRHPETGLGKIKKVGPLAEDAVEEIKNLIRRAADEASHGVKFGHLIPVKGAKGKVVLPFQAKDKKNVDMSPEAVAARKVRRAENKAAKETAK